MGARSRVIRPMSATRTAIALACALAGGACAGGALAEGVLSAGALAEGAPAVQSANAFVQTAYAADVTAWGAQTTFSEAQLAQGSGDIDINVLNFEGTPGKTVFLKVTDDGQTIADFLPYEIGSSDASSAGGIESADTFAITIPASQVATKLDAGSYSVTAVENRAGGGQLFQGSVYGVHARLSDGTDKLIGAIAGTSVFTAPDVIYDQGRAYALVSGQQGAQSSGASQAATGNGPLYFDYEAFDESTSVDGVVKYVDREGEVVESTPIPGIPYGGSKQVAIPSAITVGDKVYRTVAFESVVEAKNPEQTSFVVPVIQMSDDVRGAAGHYLAKINMVDADGNLIAADAVTVTGEFAYTAPSVIHKTQTIAGARQVVTYRIVGNPVKALSPSTDAAVVDLATRERVVTVKYEADELEPLEVNVTFNLLDGQQRANDSAQDRNLGTTRVTVNADNPTAAPAAQIDVDGKAYNLAGEAASYAYQYGSGAEPLVNAYYVPEDYVAPGPYEVTVNYVNYATNQVITSETGTSTPDSQADMQITSPEQFTEGSTTYVRLAGQEEPIAHNYYSNIKTYTVYYRDVNDELSSAAVIDRVRVEYVDAEPEETEAAEETTEAATAPTANIGATGNATNAATTATAAGAGVAGNADNAAAGNNAATANAAPAAGAEPDNPVTQAQLDQAEPYNVMDGTGNGTMTNNAGEDTPSVNISDEANPLASGVEGAPEGSAQSADKPSLVARVIPVVLAVVVIGGVALFVASRRRSNAQHR